MPNFLQKWLYNLSAGAPLLLVFSIVWYCEEMTWTVPIVCSCISIALIVLMLVAFAYGKRNLPPITITVTDVAPHDAWIVAYIVSYLLPFASMAMEDYNLLLLFSISAAIVLLAPFINSAIPNPILALFRYHFYQISAENGVSGYILISRRKIRNARAVKRVNRVFEFLLEDVEGL